MFVIIVIVIIIIIIIVIIAIIIKVISVIIIKVIIVIIIKVIIVIIIILAGRNLASPRSISRPTASSPWILATYFTWESGLYQLAYLPAQRV